MQSAYESTLRSPLYPSDSDACSISVSVGEGGRSLRERMERNPYAQPSAEEYAARMRSCQSLDFDNKSSAVHALEEMGKTRGRVLLELLWDLLTHVLLGLCTGLVAFVIFRVVYFLDQFKHSTALQAEFNLDHDDDCAAPPHTCDYEISGEALHALLDR